MKHFKSIYLLAILLTSSLIFSGCSNGDSSDDLPAGPSLAVVENLELNDEGNTGTPSDLTLTFRAPANVEGILELRAFISTAGTRQVSIDEALNLPEDRYVTFARDIEVFGVGLKLEDLALDVLGNPIGNAGSLYATVVSVPEEGGEFQGALAHSDGITEFKVSNEIRQYTPNINDIGAGDLSIDQEGNLYMGDAGYAPIPSDFGGTNQLIKITPSRDIEVYAENLNQPFGNVLASDGTLFQTGYFSGTVWRIPPGGGNKFVEAEGGFLENPGGIIMDDDGNLYVTDCGSHRVLKIDQSGNVSTFATVGFCPKGITRDDNGNFYVANNTQDGTIRKITPEGQVSVLGSIPVYKPEDYVIEYRMWIGYLTYHDDYLYIAGTSTHTIYRMSLSGEVTVFAGTGEKGLQGGDALEAKLNRPMGIVAAPDGRACSYPVRRM